MDYDRIKYAVYNVYHKCNIHRLPFNCLEVISTMGYICCSYSNLKEEQKSACLQLSADACIIGNVIYYNDQKPKRRVRFSLMNELGHLFLETQDETEANNFASSSNKPLCQKCDKPFYGPLSLNHRIEDFIIADSQWLYGGY
ncbi:MAG: ImmA/IrrE family metallo-endopeptidase [Mobilitalea sp.]